MLKIFHQEKKYDGHDARKNRTSCCKEKIKKGSDNIIQKVVNPGINPGIHNLHYNNADYFYNPIANFNNGQAANIGHAALMARPNPERYRGKGYLYDQVNNAERLVANSGQINNVRNATSDKGHRLAKQNGGTANINNMFRQDPATKRGLVDGDPNWRRAEDDFRNALNAPQPGETHALWVFGYSNDRNVVRGH